MPTSFPVIIIDAKSTQLSEQFGIPEAEIDLALVFIRKLNSRIEAGRPFTLAEVCEEYTQDCRGPNDLFLRGILLGMAFEKWTPVPVMQMS